MGTTRAGIEHFYLKGKENDDFVPRIALVEAVQLIDEAYEQKERMDLYVHEMMKLIHPMQKLEKNKLMIVAEDGVGLHRTGLYTLIKNEPISIGEEGEHFYRGIGFYSNFIDVYYSKQLLREPTEAERLHWK